MLQRSSDAVLRWQSNIREQLPELLHFNFPKIYILAHFAADIEEFGSQGMCTMDNPERIIKNLKLTYLMSNKVNTPRQIQKYQDPRTNSRHGS